MSYLKHGNSLEVSLPAAWEAAAEPWLCYQGNSAYVPASSPLPSAAFFLENLPPPLFCYCQAAFEMMVRKPTGFAASFCYQQRYR